MEIDFNLRRDRLHKQLERLDMNNAPKEKVSREDRLEDLVQYWTIKTEIAKVDLEEYNFQQWQDKVKKLKEACKNG